MGTKSNVLTGVATLSIREPNDAIAEWSTTQYQAGSRSVKLYKGGSGNAGSTHVELVPPTGTTMTLWTAGIITNSFYHHCSAVTGNFGQMEFRFEDSNSEGWAEITLVPNQTYLGTAAWVLQTMAIDTPTGYGGHTELGTSFFEWGLIDADAVQTAIEALDGAACTPGDWVLTRVRVELWETTPLRTMYVDTIEVMGTTYTIEPGGTAPGLSLSSPFVDVGYTEDGVTVDYAPTVAEIYVEEETFPVDRALTQEACSVTCNMAESSLANIGNAIAGSVVSGSILTIGAGVLKTMNLKIEGTDPAGYKCAIYIPLCTATGSVSMSYRKGSKTTIPVTFTALKGSGPAVSVVYNAA